MCFLDLIVYESERSRREGTVHRLLHHVDVDLLRSAFSWLKRDAAPGVDGRTWQQYLQNLDANPLDLHARIHRGTYRALPSRRKFIPKEDGRERPLGIASLEDKIVQRAVVKVFNAIYEEDSLGFSCGFRPGRSQHDALDALAVGITRTKVNWILDVDVRSFFDAISHDCVPLSGGRSLAANAPAAQSEGLDLVGADLALGAGLPARASHPSSLAQHPLCRQAP